MNITERISFLKDAPQKAIDAFNENAISQVVPSGVDLAMEGSDCQHFFVVLRGSIRVYIIGENGREITLYHVSPDESCVLTSFCLLSQTTFPAYATVEEETELVLIPAIHFRDWLDQFELWRGYMFSSLSMRLQAIIKTLDNVVFKPLENRICDYLIDRSPAGNGSVNITHEQLAREVGASRVAVSRILEQLERDGVIKLQRGKITVVDEAGLQR